MVNRLSTCLAYMLSACLFVRACAALQYLSIYLFIYLSIYLYTHAVLCAYTGRRIHARICLLDAAVGMENGCMYACVFVSKHAIMYPHTHIYVCMHVCMYAWMYKPIDQYIKL